MKKQLLSFFILWSFCFYTHAQVPQAINYQAVVRDAMGRPEPNNTLVKFQFIIRDSVQHIQEYTEISQLLATNQFGLATTSIGQNAALTSVNWKTGNKWLYVGVDVNNTGTFTAMGSSQLVGVPYALYSSKSDTAIYALASGSGSVNNAWGLSGNGGTNPSINFIGTTDNNSLSFRVNSTKAGIIDSTLQNTALGYSSLENNTTGFGNAAFGFGSLLNNTSGQRNTATGFQTLASNATGFGNSAFGSNSLLYNTSGLWNRELVLVL